MDLNSTAPSTIFVSTCVSISVKGLTMSFDQFSFVLFLFLTFRRSLWNPDLDLSSPVQITSPFP
jgi:hypothetical protein